MFFIMLQHNLICCSILLVSFITTRASLSRQFLPCVDILLKTLSQHKLSLSQLTCYILPIFVCDTLSFVAIEFICQYSDLCIATKEIL